jgi:hypothetical protein
MAEIFKTQSSGIAGEISKKMYGRTDIQGLIASSFRRIENMIVTPQGALFRRPGTRYIGSAKVSTGNHLFIPFIHDSSNAYLLEATDYRFRVIKNRAFIVTNNGIVTNGDFPSNITGWTDISAGTGSIAWDGTGNRMALTTGSSAGNEAIATQQVTATNGGLNFYQMTFTITSTQFTVKIGTTSPGASDIYSTDNFSSTGNQTITFETNAASFYITFQMNRLSNTEYLDDVIVRENVSITTPYSSADLPDLSYIASGQTLYMAHGSYSPRALTRTGDASWTLAAMTIREGPYFDLNDTEYGGRGTNISLTPSAASGSITMTASSSLFVSDDVGRNIRYRPSNTSDWGYMTITAYTNGTTVTANVKKTLVGLSASTEWQLGAWDDVVGYPAVVAAAEGRILFANTTTQPNGLWASAVGDPEVFRPDENYDDNVTASTSFATNIRDASDILWLSSTGSRVFAGTSDGIIAIADVALGINNITAQKVDSTRASTIFPLRAQGAAIFVSKDRETCHEMSYVFENTEEGYRAKNLNLQADHMGLNKFTQLAYQNFPIPVIWAIDAAENRLTGLTFVRSANIRAWHKHYLGGTDVKLKAIGTIPGSDDVDNLFLVVERTVNGSTVRFIEYIDEPMTEDTAKGNVYFVDAGLTYDSSSTTSLSGYNHLINESVDVLADGAIVVGKTIDTSGELTIELAASTIHVGLGYDSILETQQTEGGNPLGSAIGRKTRISDVVVQTFQSNGMQLYYKDESRRDPVLFNEGQIFGEGPNLKTGFSQVALNSGWIRSPSLVLRSTSALPMNILSITTGLEVASL